MPVQLAPCIGCVAGHMWQRQTSPIIMPPGPQVHSLAPYEQYSPATVHALRFAGACRGQPAGPVPPVPPDELVVMLPLVLVVLVAMPPVLEVIDAPPTPGPAPTPVVASVITPPVPAVADVPMPPVPEAASVVLPPTPSDEDREPPVLLDVVWVTELPQAPATVTSAAPRRRIVAVLRMFSKPGGRMARHREGPLDTFFRYRGALCKRSRRPLPRGEGAHRAHRAGLDQYSPSGGRPSFMNLAATAALRRARFSGRSGTT